MNLVMRGKVSFPSAQCEKCGETIQLWICPEKTLKCMGCGAVYLVKRTEYVDQCVEFECEFTEFQCVKSGLAESCVNTCPAPDMFCKAHLTDECYNGVHSSIVYYNNQLAAYQAQLNKMDESKRVWLINEMSGLDNG